MLAGRGGAVSPLFALLLIPLIGVLALAAEVSGWYYTQRSMQNAADTAAMAAATNGSSTYASEAWAAAAKYGFSNGVANTTVQPSTVTCPPGTPDNAKTCYRVVITKALPIYLARAVGFSGDTDVGGTRGQTISASAIASSRVDAGYCILTMSHEGSAQTAFRISGAPNTNLGGCDVFTNGSLRCNGGGGDTFGIARGYSVGALPGGSNICGSDPKGGQSPLADPIASLSNATDIPSAPGGCTSVTKLGGQTINLSAGALSVCGDLTINGAVNVAAGQSGGVIRIYNGNLVLKPGSSLVAPVGTGLTIIFTGTAGNNAAGFMTGSGTLDFGAPTSGTWAGVAVYQDSRMTKASDQIYSGNSPTFNITGLVHAPYANIGFKGAINHQTGGLACLSIISNTLEDKGGGSIFPNPTSQCYEARVTLPGGSLVSRQALVQ